MLSTFGLRPDSSGYNFKQSMAILLTAKRFVKQFRPASRAATTSSGSSGMETDPLSSGRVGTTDE